MAVESAALGAAQLDVDLPLEELVEQDAPPMFLAERGHFGGRGVPISGRPLGPAPGLRIQAMDVFAESAMDSEVLKQRAFTVEEGLEVAGAGGARGAAPPPGGRGTAGWRGGRGVGAP